MDSLVRKYNVPGPRYTSYPTVPFWKNNPLNEGDWQHSINRNREEFCSDQLSLYIHLPFCEKLCTFCGCHKRITTNHQVERPYIDSLVSEWELYKTRFTFKPDIRELHFGGGTPTFFRPDELLRLLHGIFGQEQVDPEHCHLSFEAHPNNTTPEHLEKLYHFGFRRLSLGIQDYSPQVQQAINRLQPFSKVQEVHNYARELGYSSISHDLVFGLPKQGLVDIKNTVERTLELMPDRIALYSYAHVPWVKGVGQRGYSEEDLPKDEEKRLLYEYAKGTLENAGYLEIGMDHFALPHDELAQAFQSKNLHRNFMGYTTQATPFLLGLGMSAISDSWFGFAQNEKEVEAYQERVDRGEIPIFRGHILSDLDLEIRRYILDLMCHFETTFNTSSAFREQHQQIKNALVELVKDGLVVIDGERVLVTEKGTPFVRNVCMAFDRDLQGKEIGDKLFSKTV